VKETSPMEAFVEPLWKNNPTFVQTLGMCPTMAITNTVLNGFSMGVATTFVLVGSAFFVSAFRKVIPNEVRISTYIMIIAAFTTLADLFVAALTPTIYKALGAFIALIVANCVLLARMEGFAQKNPVYPSVMDSLGTGVGFTLGLSLVASVREILGNGTFAGIHLFGSHYQPMLIFMLPPGGFLSLGFWLLFLSWWRTRKKGQRRVRLWPVVVTRRKVAA
jgi:Na+-translocating ferredoxin:NAD+ oxidoreductase subunit E